MDFDRGEFSDPEGVSVYPTDGSCWVADGGHRQVARVSATGSELWRSASGALYYPYAVSVDPIDGSCWGGGGQTGETLIHLSSAGATLGQGTGFGSTNAMAVDPSDGSCWTAGDVAIVRHVSSAGAVLWSSASTQLFSTAYSRTLSVAVNPTDGSCWVADRGMSQVVHLSATGERLVGVDDGRLLLPAFRLRQRHGWFLLGDGLRAWTSGAPVPEGAGTGPFDAGRVG